MRLGLSAEQDGSEVGDQSYQFSPGMVVQYVASDSEALACPQAAERVLRGTVTILYGHTKLLSLSLSPSPNLKRVIGKLPEWLIST
eukprot:1374109-Rhodomonas_salina.1